MKSISAFHFFVEKKYLLWSYVLHSILTLKVPITTRADDNFDFFLFSEENKS